MKNKFSKYSTVELLIFYASNFYNETKKSYIEERTILKELAYRGVIDINKMEKLYEQKAL